jgi:hypothetical protein
MVAAVFAACAGAAKAPEMSTGTGTGTGAEERAETGAQVMPAPAGFAECDAISIDGGELITWSFAGDKVTKLGSVRLASPDPEDAFAMLSGDWADRDNFFVEVPPRTVLHVTATGIAPVTVPPESALTSPRPAHDDPNLTEGGVMEGERYGLVVTEGAAHWQECPWGAPYDGWQCEVYATATLWPDADIAFDDTGVRPRSFDWLPVTVPGFRVKELDEARIVGCTPPAGTAYKQTKLKGKEEDGEHVYQLAWVSSSPPRLLVVWGTPGYDDDVPSRWALHDGCNEKPLVQGEWATPGRSPYWMGDGTVYKGATPLGAVTGGLSFRPSGS